jgi:hypothetical protein
LDEIKRLKGNNMKSYFVVLAFCLFFVASTAFASSTYYLPQVAIGSYGGDNGNIYSYRSTFVLLNNTSTSTNVTVNLTDNDGNPMMANIANLGKNLSTFTVTLGPGATRILQTDSSGEARQGAATVTSDSADIGVAGSYAINNDTTRKFVTEVGVQGISAVSLLSNFVLPVQITADGKINTALALYNPDASDSSLTLTLKNADGTVAGTPISNYSLAAGKHAAFYVNGDGFFKSIDSFNGTLTVQSSVGIAAMTLRQNAPSFLTYTSIPVASTTSTQTTFNLAQFADGDVGALYKTTFMLFNLSSTASATVTLSPTDDSGATIPLAMTAATGDTTSSTSFVLGPGQSTFLKTNGTAGKTGAVLISSTSPIGAAALFTQYNSDGSFNTEAGVLDSPVLSTFTMPIDSKAPLDGTATVVGTGLALFNSGTSAVDLQPAYLDLDGIMTTAATITLQPNQHISKFFNEIFPELGNVQGSIAFSGSSGVAAMVLRTNASPWNMTSFSVVSGTAAGLSYSTTGAGMPKALYTDITANSTISRQLNYPTMVRVSTSGFAISTTTPLYLQGISQSSGRIYKLKTETTSASTSPTLYLSPGMHAIRAMGWLTGFAAKDSGIFASYITDSFALGNTSTNKTIAFPTPTTYTVSGSIEGFGTLGLTTSASLSFYGTAATNSHVEYVVYCATDSDGNGTFTASMPDGTYYAVLRMPQPIYSTYSGTSTTENRSFQNIGTFSVSGADTTVDSLTIPAFTTLSGTANYGGSGTFAPFTITAADALLPDLGYINTNLNYYPGANLYYPRNYTWEQNTFGGAYSVTLGEGHNYNLAYTTLVYNSAGTSAGTIYYAPTSGTGLTLAGADQTYDFDTLPELPSLVLVNGNVKNALGAALASIVTARSSSILDSNGNIIPGLSYYATATADSSGNYNIWVLPGRDYQLYFSSNLEIIAQ